VVGVPLSFKLAMLTVPAVVRPEKSRPGGIVPPTFHDWMGVCVGLTVNEIETAVPTVTVVPVADPVEGASGVAPAREFIAPREAAMAANDFNTVPMGDSITHSSTLAMTCGAGVRCNNAIKDNVGRLIRLS
jgi:hypothetical protein